MMLSRMACVAGLLIHAAAAIAAPSYTLVDLGAGTTAGAINARGEVLGTRDNEFRPWVWRDGQWHALEYLPQSQVIMHALSNADIGVATELRFGIMQAVMWTPDKQRVDLSALLPPATYSEATGVTADGTVIGSVGGGGAQYRPFVVKDGLLTIYPCPEHIESCEATGASPNGIVAGTLQRRDTGAAALWHNGEWHDIGTLGGSSAAALAVNRHGHAVGGSWLAGDDTGSAFFYADHKMTDLGLMGGYYSLATALNDEDTVVGEVGIFTGFYETRGFVWQAGEGWWLDNVVVDLPPHWILVRANGVNNKGWIVGTAAVGKGKESHGFLLKPTGL